MRGIFGLVVLALVLLTWRACEAPLVYKDVNGTVCGCQTKEDYVPSLEACKKVDFNKIHKYISVSKCEE